MGIGQYLSLREAIQEGLLKRFASEHKTTGDREKFADVLTAMIRTPSKGDQASDPKNRCED